MTIISSRKQIRPFLDQLISNNSYLDDVFWNSLDSEILQQKVKFPILEFVSEKFYRQIPSSDQINFLDRTIAYNRIPSFVIAGKMLQLRLNAHWQESFDKSVEYMVLGDEWYTCDIIAERVFGMALLNDFDAALSMLESYIIHENKWIRRAPGIGAHLAVKWGLDKEYLPALFTLLKKQIQTKDYHVKKGCGWGIETMTKFHPEFMQQYETILLDKSTNAWVRSKYKLGLKKSAKIREKGSTK